MLLASSKDHALAPFSDAIAAVKYHIRSGGRRVRAQLAHGAGIALKIDPDHAVVIATTVELLHNASLIHDDLQDRSRSRRGLPSVWLEFGDGIAVCAGDLLISAAYRNLVSFPIIDVVPALFRLTHDAVTQSICGQCADLAAQRQYPQDLGAYERIVAAKSGALLSLPLELSLLASGYSDAMPLARRAADSFATGYQIADDLADVAADKGNDHSPKALNLVLLLQASGLGAEAKDKARSIAMRHLKASAIMANDLPQESGALLSKLALSLCEEL